MSQKENCEKIDVVLPNIPKLLTRLESTPLLPSQLRKNEMEHLNLSPIDEPDSMMRSIQQRQSLRPVKSSIATNGTLNYCTPRLSRKTESSMEVPRFKTDYSLCDLSRNLQQQQPSVSSQTSSQTRSTSCDSELNAELEEILAQLDQLFPSDDGQSHSRENVTIVKATNRIAGVMAEFVDGFKD